MASLIIGFPDKMKMISRILLLLILSSCLCATFVVNVTQSSYQAEENHSITLEWTFPTKTQGSSRKLFIICSLLSPHKELVLYHIHKGVEIPESQDEQFSGRVQIDKDVLREGRIRLHVSRLRTEDSGLYLCGVKTEDGFNSGRCRLNVSSLKTVKSTVPHRNLISPTPQKETRRKGESAGRRSRMFLVFPVFLFIISLSSLFIISLKNCSKTTKFQQNPLRASALQFCCLAPEQTCVDVEKNSIQSLIVTPDQLRRHGNCGG
ncbi:uncharacterized protein LOC114156969 isoform X3 [Xiphophorus couchianus]|uniref:uncharacterized protein LOC114156969 isoform X3 n=2 Tax=Xiphophorus couchianus TaxID=32473 RepID=UPI001015F3EA|nr:uncharacterized protein LOC114156969 isoform X3 [Xiphophorus couchianus]